MVVNKYKFTIVLNSSEVPDATIQNIVNDLTNIIVPRKDGLSVDKEDSTATITIVSATSFKKGVVWRDLVSAAVGLKYSDHFAKMYYELNDSKMPGFTIFHKPPSETHKDYHRAQKTNHYVTANGKPGKHHKARMFQQR